LRASISAAMFAPRYNPTKLKLNLKLAITRLGMLQKKNGPWFAVVWLPRIGV